MLGTKPGWLIIQGVCMLMVRELERRRGCPTLASQRHTVRLWHLDRFAKFSSKETPWLREPGRGAGVPNQFAPDRRLRSMQSGITDRRSIRNRHAAQRPRTAELTADAPGLWESRCLPCCLAWRPRRRGESECVAAPAGKHVTMERRVAMIQQILRAGRIHVFGGT